jgi:7-carboxy-7-deazaguanine synthase
MELILGLPYIRIEIETNGTISPNGDTLINQYNVSPKTSNSGMPARRRIKPEVMERFSDLSLQNRAIFKFVVTSEQDMDEIIQDFIHPFRLPKRNIWLMPGCANREQYEQTAPVVAEICKKTGFQFSSRLQINLWNEVTGV